MPYTRDEVIAIADSYIQGGLVGKDPNVVKLAPDVYRVENGWDTGQNAATINDQLLFAHKGLDGVRNQRWFVEGHEAFSIFDLVRTQGPDIGPIMEYFRVADGLIREVSPTFRADAAGWNFLGPANPKHVLPEARKQRSGVAAETARAVEALFSAIASHTVERAPLGVDVTMTEHRQEKARGEQATRQWLATGLYTEVRDVDLLRSVVEGKEAVVRYRFTLHDGRLLYGSQYARVHAGLIRELFSNYGEGPSPQAIAQFNAKQRDPRIVVK